MGEDSGSIEDEAAGRRAGNAYTVRERREGGFSRVRAGDDGVLRSACVPCKAHAGGSSGEFPTVKGGPDGLLDHVRRLSAPEASS